MLFEIEKQAFVFANNVSYIPGINVIKKEWILFSVIHGDETGIEEEVNVDGKIFKVSQSHD